MELNGIPSAYIDGFGEIEWYDVRKQPIELYGAFDKDNFLRIDPSIAEQLNEYVLRVYRNTSGIRARLTTNSPFFAVCCELDEVKSDNTMPLSGVSGFDLYDDSINRYEWTVAPDYPERIFQQAMHFRNTTDIHSITLNFPLYNGVKKLLFGIKKGCEMLKGREYDKRKIVYYGSSITQGADASRPGMCYQSIIARRTNFDYVNLGFSSGALGEDIMADYIGSLDMDMLVLDYDYNAPTPEYLEKTHERFFKRFREKQPNTPVILISSPSLPDEKRIAIIESTYKNALSHGDKNVYFINGRTFFFDKVGCDYTADGTHPDDAGFVAMAEIIGDKIISVFEGK